ncbi:MAG: hypothetical protein QGH20_09915 [Candidatus Latescibacteria bacterium]|nr:hypothetical protein [Candidatus Latescibacterota bacterium]
MTDSTLRMLHNSGLVLMLAGIADFLAGVMIDMAFLPLYYGAIPAGCGFLSYLLTRPKQPTLE